MSDVNIMYPAVHLFNNFQLLIIPVGLSSIFIYWIVFFPSIFWAIYEIYLIFLIRTLLYIFEVLT